MSLAPLFMAPFGPSREGPYGFSGISGLWNTENHGTDGPVTCEICGTTHPENRSESYLTFRFFGRQGVEQCCGALLDEAYRQFGDRITEAYLNNCRRPLLGRIRLFPSHPSKRPREGRVPSQHGCRRNQIDGLTGTKVSQVRNHYQSGPKGPLLLLPSLHLIQKIGGS